MVLHGNDEKREGARARGLLEGAGERQAPGKGGSLEGSSRRKENQENATPVKLCNGIAHAQEQNGGGIGR